MKIRKKHLEKLAKKIVRGIVFVVDGKYIEPPYHIDFYPYNREAIKNLLINIHPGPWDVFERPPGFVVLRAVIKEDISSAIYLIDIWGQFYFSAVVINF